MKTKMEKEALLPSENSSEKLTESDSEHYEPGSVQLTLNFIDDFFSNYFNHNDKVPSSYLAISKQGIKRQIKKIVSVLTASSTVDKGLSKIVMQSLCEFTPDIPGGITYSRLVYRKKLINELSAENILQSTQTIREKLFSLNFNEDNFVVYEYARLQQFIENIASRKEKITTLRFEQKTINQLPVKVNGCYSKFMPSLKEQINGWI